MDLEEIENYRSAYRDLFLLLPTRVQLEILSHQNGKAAANLAFQALREIQKPGNKQAQALEMIAATE
jgi:hypothetical protein